MGASEANPPEETAAPKSTDEGNSAEKEARPGQERRRKERNVRPKKHPGPRPATTW